MAHSRAHASIYLHQQIQQLAESHCTETALAAVESSDWTSSSEMGGEAPGKEAARSDTPDGASGTVGVMRPCRQIAFSNLSLQPGPSQTAHAFQEASTSGAALSIFLFMAATVYPCKAGPCHCMLGHDLCHQTCSKTSSFCSQHVVDVHRVSQVLP